LASSLTKPEIFETTDKVNGLSKRMNIVLYVLEPVLKDWDCARLSESNPCKLYHGDSALKQQLDGILNASKQTSKLYGLMSQALNPSMQQIDLALAQASQSVMQSERNVPTISSKLSNSGVPSNGINSDQKFRPPISASSVRQFYDPQKYNWLSYENVSSEGISITFIPKIPGRGGNNIKLLPGAHGTTGRSSQEVQAMGGFELYVCPLGYVPVDANNQYVNKIDTPNFRCKRQ